MPYSLHTAYCCSRRVPREALAALVPHISLLNLGTNTASSSAVPYFVAAASGIFFCPLRAAALPALALRLQSDGDVLLEALDSSSSARRRLLVSPTCLGLRLDVPLLLVRAGELRLQLALSFSSAFAHSSPHALRLDLSTQPSFFFSAALSFGLSLSSGLFFCAATLSLFRQQAGLFDGFHARIFAKS